MDAGDANGKFYRVAEREMCFSGPGELGWHAMEGEDEVVIG